jgi:hypothetical protein
MGRPPVAERLKQVSVALPAETRSLLEAAASAGRHSVAEEIRARLERTFKEDSADAPTRELQLGIANIAALLREPSGADWWTSSAGHHAFSAAVAERLAGYAPPPPPAPSPSAFDLFASSGLFGDPETVGRVREHDDRGAHAYPILTETLARKSKQRTHSMARAIRGKGKQS